MYVGGEWVDKPEKAVVRNKYDGTEIDTVPLADAADVDRAVASAVRGAEVMRKMPAYDRYQILRRASGPARSAAGGVRQNDHSGGG
jgi:acyl-CoA reductase-like NAD-dependent aldehyde dehydrogenase